MIKRARFERALFISAFSMKEFISYKIFISLSISMNLFPKTGEFMMNISLNLTSKYFKIKKGEMK
jgi:hypothetical protein